MAAWSRASSLGVAGARGCVVIRSAPPASISPKSVPFSTSTWPWSSGWRGVQLELGARVGDVEVAHRELADPVGRAEGGVLGALHRQLVRVVGERRAVGAQDRVVLAAAQPQRHLAGDERRRPSAGSTRAASAPAGPASGPRRAAGPGGGPRRGSWRWCPRCGSALSEPLVGDPEQRHARRLVDAAGLGLDDPVLDLVGHAQAVPAADRVGLVHQRDRVVVRAAVDRDRAARPRSAIVTSSVSMATDGSQNFTPMIGSTVSSETSRCSRVLASWVAPQMLASVEYAFSWLSR